MIVKEYRVSRAAIAYCHAIDQFEIAISLEPNWLERTFGSKVFAQKRIMHGSCLTWHWEDGTSLDYFWKVWAVRAVHRAIITGEFSYVNSRFNRPQDGHDHTDRDY